MNSTDVHTTERTSQRRVAVLASIRAARNMGRAWNVAAVALGAGVAAILSGFALWTPIVSLASVFASIVVAIAVAWAGAVLLPRPSAGVMWFAGPITVGLVCAAIMREWAGFGVLLGCVVIPLVSLAVYQSDARRHA